MTSIGFQFKGDLMQTGVVKWFNNAKGYGFILSDDGNIDIFAHYSAIEMEGYRTLKAGQCVSFETVEGTKGLHASDITLLETVQVPTAQFNDDQQPAEPTKQAGLSESIETTE
jgi:CspA family cold shock protein